MREDGYAPIEAYAALGDGRTVALVARDGSIDWLPAPDLDDRPVFAALIDSERGGSCRLAPVGEFTTSRRYLPDTNMLETTFQAPLGKVCVTDALTLGASGRLPWVEVAREVRCIEGEVDLAWSVSLSRLEDSPWIHDEGGTPILRLGNVSVAVNAFELGHVAVEAGRAHGRVTLRAGDRGLLALPVSADGFLTLPSRENIEARLGHTRDLWGGWTSRISYDGPWRDEVVRSALALSLLQFAPNGAIAAAPTTSLPERVGGDKNWDYRFCWIRDGSFSIDALLRLGLSEEAHAALAWLLAAVEATTPDIHVFYNLDGSVAANDTEVDADGYRGSKPVRKGNQATGQQQLGSYGDLLDAVWQGAHRGTRLDERTSRMLGDIADRVCDSWRREDSGIWELTELRHYTISKIGCWVALDRAVRLAEERMLASRHVDRWRTERDTIRHWVDENCWSEKKQSYTFYAGTDDLDASVLLAARTGFCARGDPRLATTADAVRGELGDGPFLYRYTGMAKEEGAFIACSFWLAEALRHTGRPEEAGELIAQVIDAANDVGLYAEQLDPSDGSFLGNFPQGLSHLALILAVV